MLLIGGGRMITRDPENPYWENGAVLIGEDGLIAEIGSLEEVRARHPDCAFLDARGGVIMPGLINVHDHIYSAFARGLSIKNSNPKGFLQILDGLWWTIDRHLTNRDTEKSADAIFLECVENGVTTVFDHHASYGEIPGSLFCIAESAKRFGVRANLCYEVSDRDGEEKMRQGVRENVEFMAAARRDKGDRLSGMMGLHAPFTLSNDTLSYCIEQNPQNAGYHIHVAEGIEDVYDSLKKHGKRPVFRLHDFGILGDKTICGHCTHVSEAEMDVLAQTRSLVAHNPESNMGNAIGCPPAMEMMRRGIPVGLGTDGYTSDMLESYKVGNLLHKHSLCDSTAAWAEIPEMLFVNNPKIVGRFFEKPVGVLKKGAHGDVITLDYIPYTPMNAGNINSHVLFGMNGGKVRNTVSDGRVLMKDRVVQCADREQVLAHCREQAQDFWRRVNSGR